MDNINWLDKKLTLAPWIKVGKNKLRKKNLFGKPDIRGTYIRSTSF